MDEGALFWTVLALWGAAIIHLLQLIITKRARDPSAMADGETLLQSIFNRRYIYITLFSFLAFLLPAILGMQFPRLGGGPVSASDGRLERVEAMQARTRERLSAIERRGPAIPPPTTATPRAVDTEILAELRANRAERERLARGPTGSSGIDYGWAVLGLMMIVAGSFFWAGGFSWLRTKFGDGHGGR